MRPQLDDHEMEIAANRSIFDEHATPMRTRRTDCMRIAPLRRSRIAVGRRMVIDFASVLAIVFVLVVLGWLWVK
jgi:hypothetical protein